MTLYRLVDHVPGTDRTAQYRGRLTGEFRPPRAGEWYLSGAIPEGYRAPNDLSTAYRILRLVRAEKVEYWREVESR